MSPIKQMLQNLIRKELGGDLLDFSVDMVNYYFNYAVMFEENYLVVQRYKDFVWIDFFEWIIKNYHKIKNINSEERETDFNFKKSILKAKILTHNERKEIFHFWLSNPKNINTIKKKLEELKWEIDPILEQQEHYSKIYNNLENENSISCYVCERLNYCASKSNCLKHEIHDKDVLLLMLMLYPTYNNLKDVKKELGLTKTIEKLEKELRNMKNGKSK